MPYSVKEVFYTLQGEGANVGRPAVFCRFTGCNLWTGRERDRKVAICRFCDTDFVGTDGMGGGRFDTAAALADHVAMKWPAGSTQQGFVVCTGGEPLLQLDRDLIDALHARRFEIAVETNGTLSAPLGIDWICVSPKAQTDLAIREGDEIKLIYPQEGAAPHQFEHLRFEHRFLQPMHGPHIESNTQAAIAYCLKHPRWRLSLQTHKILGIP